MGILGKLLVRDNQIDVLDLLESQHKEVDLLIEQIEKGEGDRRALFTELADKLAAHSTVEEKLFYPAIMAKETNDQLQEAVQEHLQLKRMLADMLGMNVDSEQFLAKLKVLKEQVTHHAHEEEEDKLFPKVRDLMTKEELMGLGNDVLAMFEELMRSNPSKNVPNETRSAARLPTPPR